MTTQDPTPATPPIEATFRLEAGTRARITVEILDETGQSLETGTVDLRAPTAQPLEETLVFQPPVSSENTPPMSEQPPLSVRLRQSLAGEQGLATWLFVLGLGVYLGARLIGLTSFPISFLADEARPTVLAMDLVRENFVYEGIFLPTFFPNARGYNLGTSVYLNLFPALVLGESVWVVRGFAVLLSLWAAVSVGLILKQIFLKPYWWLAPLLLSVTPVWFLHSRTGLDSLAAVSFFAAFLYFYLRYRTEQPQALYYALIFGALTFYTSAPAQVVMAAMGLVLLLVDFRYHLANWRVTLRGAGLFILLALPYARFWLAHPLELGEDLQIAHVYLPGDTLWTEKVYQFYGAYLARLNPFYWYFPNGMESPLHAMGKQGHLLWITLPFALIGVVDAVQYAASPAWRVVVLAGLVAPLGAALTLQGVDAALFVVIPITLLTMLGVIKGLEWGEALFAVRRGTGKVFPPSSIAPSRRLAWGLFGVLALLNGAYLANALINGPKWTTDYSLNGMQFGGRQVFEEMRVLLQENREMKFKVATDWAVDLRVLARFFLEEPLPVEFENLSAYTSSHREIPADTRFVVPFNQFIEYSDTHKFVFQVEHEILDPTGRPALVFVKVDYVPNIDDMLAEETAARRALIDAAVDFDGTTIPIRYPSLDIGEIPYIFDGNPETLIRTALANPLVLEMYLPAPRVVSGMEFQIGATLAQITVKISSDQNATPFVFTQELEGTLDNPSVFMDFGETVTGSVIRIEIQDKRQDEPGHVHLWEVHLR